jgi:hypothetical protein
MADEGEAVTLRQISRSSKNSNWLPVLFTVASFNCKCFKVCISCAYYMLTRCMVGYLANIQGQCCLIQIVIAAHCEMLIAQ